MAKLTLHRFEGVVNHLAERLVRPVVLLFLFCDQFVTWRNCYIDANAKRISFLMGVVRLFDRDITPVDVVAKFLQMRRFSQDILFSVRRIFRRRDM